MLACGLEFLLRVLKLYLVSAVFGLMKVFFGVAMLVLLSEPVGLA